MLVLFLNWLGRQCPILGLSGVPLDGLQPRRTSRRHFPISVARRPPPTSNRWLARGLFQHHETSDSLQRVALSQRFAFKVCPFEQSTLRWIVAVAIVPACFGLASQAQARKQVLIINELGQSHPGPAFVTNQLHSALDLDKRFQEEIYTENLDAADLSDDELNERRDSLVQKYRHHRLDVIVAVGPDTASWGEPLG
jgi:hypothetical protein